MGRKPRTAAPPPLASRPAEPEPIPTPFQRLWYVRTERGAEVWHLAPTPVAEALCGGPRPGPGWWDAHEESPALYVERWELCPPCRGRAGR